MPLYNGDYKKYSDYQYLQIFHQGLLSVKITDFQQETIADWFAWGYDASYLSPSSEKKKLTAKLQMKKGNPAE